MCGYKQNYSNITLFKIMDDIKTTQVKQLSLFMILFLFVIHTSQYSLKLRT